MAPIVPERRKRRLVPDNSNHFYSNDEQHSNRQQQQQPSSDGQGQATVATDGHYYAAPVIIDDTVDSAKQPATVSPAKKARLLQPTINENENVNHYPVVTATPRQVRPVTYTPTVAPRTPKTPSNPLRTSTAFSASTSKKQSADPDSCIEAGYKFAPSATSLLGEGGFSKVRQAVHIKTGISVAIKCMEKARLGPDEPRVKTEIHALKTLGRHENIARLYQVVETPSRIFLVMELCPGGELFDYISKSGKLSENITRGILGQILQVLSFIHSKGFAHRDLKPENILLAPISGFAPKVTGGSGIGGTAKKNTENYYAHFTRHPTDIRIKLIDFGLAADCSNGAGPTHAAGIESLSTCCGSPAYAAPELISGSARPYSGRKIDVWSTGIITFACLAGKLPFQDDSSLSALYKLILSGTYHVPSHVSKVACDFISKMLQVDPAARAPVSKLLAHPFLARDGDDNYPIKVNEENMDEEILWFCQNKFFPASDLGQLRRDIRTKFGYETASYWLVKDHGLHELNRINRQSLAQNSPLWSKFQHPTVSSPRPLPPTTATPARAVHNQLVVPRPPTVTRAAPSPAVHFLSVASRAESALKPKPTFVNTSPGHALSPINVNALASSPAPRAKRSLFVSKSAGKGTGTRFGSVERLLARKTPPKKMAAMDGAATTGKKKKSGKSGIMGLIRTKLMFN